jgi:hypothetical protein
MFGMLSHSLWDRDHYMLYHQMPSPENMQRLVGLAVAERQFMSSVAGSSPLMAVYRLWDHLNPRSSRANLEEAAQYAAATAKYLYERVSQRGAACRYYVVSFWYPCGLC